MDLLDNVEQFIATLRKIDDASGSTLVKREHCMSCLEVFATVWNNLMAVLREPQLSQRAVFVGNLDRVATDIGAIIERLILDLGACKQIGRAARKIFRFQFNHRAEHPLVLFFGMRNVNLGQAQIVHGTRVAELMLFAALHFLSAGYPHRDGDSHAQLLNQQREVAQKELHARNEANSAERHFRRSAPRTRRRETPDLHGNWTHGYDRIDVASGNPLPLDVVANRWFQVPVLENESLWNDVRHLRAEQAQWRDEQAGMREQLRNTNAECQAVTRQYAELMTQHQTLIQKHNELVTTYNNLWHEYSEYQQACDEDEERWRVRLDTADRRRKDAELERENLRRQLDDLQARPSCPPSSWNGRSARVTIGRSTSRSPSNDRSDARSGHGSASSSRGTSPGCSDSGISMSSSSHKHRRRRSSRGSE